MKPFKILIVLSLAFMTLHLDAQKFGFTNSAMIMSEVPEVKQAESNLKAYQEQLTKQGQIKVEALQSKYQELARKEKQGEIAPKALQEQSEKLKAEEDDLAKLEQDMQGQLAQKREALLQPILDKINKGIQDVAKEHGYSFIFDSSAGMLLYADESNDVTTLVRSKLGLTATASVTPAAGTEVKKDTPVKKQ
ncbi:MAG: OmpH family outer membrane protein [Saprospiraceae bacterium]